MVKRRFLLSDLMLIVATLAFAGAYIRSYLKVYAYLLFPEYGIHLRDFFETIRTLSQPIAAALSLSGLVLRLRSPRPRRRLFRQPGFIACLLSSLLSVSGLIALGVHELHIFGDAWRIEPSGIFITFCEGSGFAVGGAWLALWLASAWRAERSWIDRYGRLVGWVWIVLGALELTMILPL